MLLMVNRAHHHMHANEWHKTNVFIQQFVGCEKDSTAKVNSNNCNKFTKDAARHTLLLKNMLGL